MRNREVDALKGIGIIAMMVGHYPIFPGVKSFLYLWHIPLFFIVSGFFFREKPFRQFLYSNYRTLIIPYILLGFSKLLLKITCNGSSDNLMPIVNHEILSMLVGSGSHSNPVFGDFFVGAPWFFLALFWCRILSQLSSRVRRQTIIYDKTYWGGYF